MDATVVTPAVEATPQWMQIVMSVLGALITAFILPWLKQHADAAKAAAAQSKVDTASSLLNQKTVIIQQLESFLLNAADAIAEQRLPTLCQRVAAGELRTPESIKAELKTWGAVVKQQAIDFFKSQGVDIVAALGETYIDQAIAFAANKTAPFPGKETAVELLKDKVVPMLLAMGRKWVQKWYSGDLSAYESSQLPDAIDPSVPAGTTTVTTA
jgi:hypothetical protein